jgi:hypothetical protein
MAGNGAMYQETIAARFADAAAGYGKIIAGKTHLNVLYFKEKAYLCQPIIIQIY